MHASWAQTTTGNESNNWRQLIDASQTGSMPLRFEVNDSNANLAEICKFDNDKEFRIRGGIPHFLKKIKDGKAVTLGYIGGSITRADNQYRTQSLEYIQLFFPV